VLNLAHFEPSREIKAVSMRSYQDAMIRLRLLATGNTVGPRVSMSDHVKDGKATRLFLDARLPGYVDWFLEWRDVRDRLKIGVPFEMQSLAGELGLVFTGVSTPTPVGLTTSAPCSSAPPSRISPARSPANEKRRGKLRDASHRRC
jgi:hypothetical protein